MAIKWFSKKNIPNFLTTFRLILIPVLVLSFYVPGVAANIFAATLFTTAAVTDYFDGYYARALKAQSDFGKCLDPIADKLLVIVAIVMLINFHPRNPIILFPGLIIICREVLVSGLREFLAEFQVSVPVSRLAKYKTMVQMTAITGLLLGEGGSSYAMQYWFGDVVGFDIRAIIITILILLSQILFFAAAVLTVMTGYSYFKVGFRNMK